MRNERENILNSNSSSADSGILSPENFNILGNDITAFYDGSHKLVFVLDLVINNIKPNVLLVINSIGDRKWDDILANDFGVNLESIRPKKDNKYQKLDIEYNGLSVYDDLINAFKSGNNLQNAFDKLAGFRNVATKRAAVERFDAANTIIENTTETIRKTIDTVKDLKSRLKGFRAKLMEQRHQIGKEPTKQSAAKILRTEAQIDDTNAKIKRTEKRLKNAEKRLSVANEDASIAKALIARLKNEPMADFDNTPVLQTVATPVKVATPMAETDDDDADDVLVDKVNPLIEKDPNILNNNIAFKPIDFGNIKLSDNTSEEVALPAAAKTETVESVQIKEEPIKEVAEVDDVVEEPAFKPLSFAPIDFGAGLSSDNKMPEPVGVPKKLIDESASFNSAGLYDDVKNDVVVEVPKDIALKPIDVVIPALTVKPDSDFALNPIVGTAAIMPATSDVKPINPVILNTENQPVINNIAIDDKLIRPISPLVTGQNAIELTTSAHKPTVLYYLMLLMLIVLSIFTLWMYQNSIGDDNVVPDLTVVAPTTTKVETQTPFINTEIANTESMRATEKQPDTTTVENQTVPNFE